jgi:TonB-dependent receptor
MRVFYCLVTVFFLSLLVPVITFGQASLKGTITDVTTNETLIGVNVIVQGTSLGAATNIEGQVRIVGIPERLFTLRVSYIGYEPQLIEIDFSKTKDVSLNLQLKPTVIEGKEVVVTAQMRGQMAAINQQITSNTIVNIVSEEKIKELPDANAAEAIGRLPGVSIIRSGGEASQVVLRGLSSKFSNITIDGVKIPATDANTRDVDLSTISQGSLAGIELYKTLMPYQDADAIAGTVNLVTRKAPTERLIRVDLTGSHNKLTNSFGQYVFQGQYGERFLDNRLGLQLQGNIEKRIRSNDSTGYNWQGQKSTAYANDSATGKYSAYNDYVSLGYGTVTFTDEIRTRNGIKAIIDFDTPDSGSVKLSGLYSETGRDITTHNRVYVGTNSSAYWDYNYRYDELRISTVNASLQGKNFLGGLEFDWCASYAKSATDNPYDFALKFTGGGASGAVSNTLEGLIDRADNDFSAAQCSTGVYKRKNNFDQEKTAFVNISKKYTISTLFSGEIKAGGKYKNKSRWMAAEEYDDNNYLHGYIYYDGIDTVALKDSRFTSYYNSTFQMPLTQFLDSPLKSRNLLGKYSMSPFINVDALKLWYSLLKNANNAGNPEFVYSEAGRLTDYNVIERVSSIYLMNTLDIGQSATLMIGIRGEKENNDYIGKYCTGSTGTVGIAVTTSRPIVDSVAKFSQTQWLPNIQMTLKPTSFLNVRLAAYKAIARPDYNLRLPQFFDQQITGGIQQVTTGNLNLKNMEAWDYEVNTQLFGGTIGLISISGFYKKVYNYIHVTNNINLENGQFDSLCRKYDMVFTDSDISTTIHSGNGVRANIAYNDPDPSYVYGLEFEHQMNLGFLPGYLKYITLSYNISLTRSITHIIYGITNVRIKADSSLIPLSNPRRYRYSYSPEYSLTFTTKENESEGQPNLYGNAAIGYDIGGFSARLSFFYQGSYVRSYSARDQANVHVDPFFKMDLSIKQQITNMVSVFLNVNNLLNKSEKTTEENAYTDASIHTWVNPDTELLYGRTIDLGIRLSF